MQGSKWAPNPAAPDPFAKLQAVFRKTPKSVPDAASAYSPIRYPVREFVPHATQPISTLVTPAADEPTANSIGNGHELPFTTSQSTREAAKPAVGEKTFLFASPFAAEDPTRLTSTAGTKFRPFEPAPNRETGFKNGPDVLSNSLGSRTTIIHEPGKPASATQSLIPTASHSENKSTEAGPSTEDDLSEMAREIAEWEAKERRKAERLIAEKKKALLAERIARTRQQEEAPLAQPSREGHELRQKEATTQARDVSELPGPRYKWKESSEESNVRDISTPVSDAPCGFKSLAPSVFGATQPEKLGFITSRPLVASQLPAVQPETASRVKTTNASARVAHPAVNSTADPPHFAKQKDGGEHLTQDRAYHDKQRETAHLQKSQIAKAAFLSSSNGSITAEHKPNDQVSANTVLLPPPPRTMDFRFEFSAGADSMSNGSALSKLHTRPAITSNGAQTTDSAAVQIPERRTSITPPRDDSVTDALKKTSLSEKGSDALAVKKIEAKATVTTEPPPHQKKKKTAEGDFLQMVQNPPKPLTEVQRSSGSKRSQTQNASTTPDALPVDKLAFTLRSSSRENENHPGRIETTNRDPLATAHAAMNEIDRTNVKTQGELVFKAWPKPQDRPATFVRRVHISGLPLDFTASQVLSLVWGGRIERIEYKSKSGNAMVLFMTHEDCEKYYKATCNGVDIPGQAGKFALVKLADRPEAAHEFLRGLIAVEATRCIRAIGVDPAFGMSALTKLAMGGKREVERIVNGTNPKGLRAVEFRFLNVYDAMRFKSELEKLDDWEPCNILCAPDPCARATGVHVGVGL